MARPRFEKVVLATLPNAVGKAQMNTFSAVGDIDGDGRPDVVVSGRNGRMAWLRNTGKPRGPWPLNPVADVTNQECGGSLCALGGPNGLDIINGGDYASTTLNWWRNPRGSGGPWRMNLIADTGCGQFHDTIIGDVTGDGTISLVFTNQHGKGGTTIYRVAIPAEPEQGPWPGMEVVASGLSEPNPGRRDGRQPEEGLAIADVDGDGLPEIVCGTCWHKRLRGGGWETHRFASGMITTKVAVGDIDGDGRDEIVLSEGDPCVYGRPAGGRLAWYKAPTDPRQPWTEHVLMDGLLDAHSLQLADLCGNGRLDILVGEVGVADDSDNYTVRPPRLMVLENAGGGQFVEHVIDEGTGIHDGVLVDLFGRGALDIVGKPLHGAEKWNVHAYFSRME